MNVLEILKTFFSSLVYLCGLSCCDSILYDEKINLNEKLRIKRKQAVVDCFTQLAQNELEI
jgi:hypothetical protein